ncbi:MAG: SAM-dependent methyltransferase, partial [Chitinophagaceae bacterium]|nr:SAM-dependent methyltransferase [Chitinophagaceae bacterium]
MNIQLFIDYIKYYLSSSNGKGHGVHSPFVFDFITNVLNNKKHYYTYDQVEALRQKLAEDRTT